MLRKWIGRALGKPAQKPSPVVEKTRLRVSCEARAVVQNDSLAILHATRGSVFKANRAGAVIWEALAQETPLPLVVEQLAALYGIPCRQAEHDVTAFVAQLRNAHLVSGGSM